MFAGTVDRLAPPEQAIALWEHWGRPEIHWYHGGHVSYLVEPAVKRFIRDAFEQTGVWL